MRPYKMQIDCVDDGQKALDAIRDAKPQYNAVFMDHMMPGMDGIEAARCIREIDSDYAKNLPIIALTANAIVGNEEMFLNNGFQAFLTKPIDVFRLDNVIRQWVQNKEEKLLPEGGEASAAIQEETGMLAFNKKIAGLDLTKGLERFDGNEKVYLKILRSYVTSTRSLLDSIENTSEEKLADYRLAVHGIKGASLNILADQISSLASDLEKAAKAADFAYVSKHNPAFVEAAWKLIHELEEMLVAMENISMENIS